MDGPCQSANEENSVIWPELWEAFASHRQSVTEFLISVATRPDSSLCVWGAGRTTDLDLISLLKHYGQIDLLDLNEEITSQALVQRGFDEHANVRVLPATDISGLNEHWDRIRALPNDLKVAEIARVCSETRLDMGSYDVVASTCLMSQILRHAVGHLNLASEASYRSPALFAALKLIREKHIELMLEHTSPGGVSLLITDLTSDDALPRMLDEGVDLQQLVSTEVMKGNHFHGVNPKSIAESFRSPRFANSIRAMKVSSPWIWDSIETKYLCLAFRCQKQ